MKIKRIHFIFILLTCLFLGFFLYVKVAPFGQWSCSFYLNRDSHVFLGRGCFSQPSPNERFVKEAKTIKMLGDPLYFSLYSPRNFDQVKISLIFKPNLDINNPIIEAGLLVDKNLWRYKLKPVYNHWLEKDFKDWTQVGQIDNLWYRGDNLIIGEKDSLDSILSNNCSDLDFNNCLVQYNLKSEQIDLLPDLSLSQKNKELKKINFNTALRGHHSFYIYLKNNDLNLSLKVKDLNRNLDTDDIDIEVYAYNNLIFKQNFIDDRLELEGINQESDLFDISINLNSLPSGLYRIDLNANDDMVFDSIEVESTILSWRNRLWLFSSQDEDISLFTDSKSLQIKVLEPSAYQLINFGQESLELNTLYKQNQIIQKKDKLAKIYPVSLEKGGVLLESSGVFSFEESLLFNPSYSRLDRFYNNQAKFILANYNLVDKLPDGYYLAELYFDLNGVIRLEDKYNFILSAPGLRAEDKTNNYIEIKEIKAEFSGKSLKEKIYGQ